MLALLLVLFLQAPPYSYPPVNTGPRAGVEVNLNWPAATVLNAMNACVNASQGAGCNVRVTPGRYYLKEQVNVPNGVLGMDFTGVVVTPCASMPWMFYQPTMGPWMGAITAGLDENAADYTAPCGSFTPPLQDVFHHS